MARRTEQHLNADDLKVLTKREWCKLNSLSFSTGKRLLAEGPPNGPPTIQLSPRRVGVRMIDNARWQQARVRGE